MNKDAESGQRARDPANVATAGQAPLGIGFNHHKAGLDRTVVDRAVIQATVVEASRGSKFFVNEERKDALVAPKLDRMTREAAALRSREGAQRLKASQAIVDKEIVPQMEATMRDMSRTIAHVDMDCFYCAVELLRQPHLRGLPIAVGGNSMLCTSSYEARKYGVRAAMPGFIAKKLCPDLVMVPPNFTVYTEYSNKVRRVLAEFDPHFLMGSLDEAYLDLTDFLSANPSLSPDDAAAEVRRRVYQATNLTCSAGLAPNTLLAKIASDMNKPDGQTVLTHLTTRDAVLEFIAPLPARKIPGVGKRMEAVLDVLGVRTCGDVFSERAVLRELITPKSFHFLLQSAGLGLASTRVDGDGEGNSTSQRRGISRERSFAPVKDCQAIRAIVENICHLLGEDMAQRRLQGRQLTVKLKKSDFTVLSRSKSLRSRMSLSHDLFKEAWELIQKQLPLELRLIGVRMSSFDEGEACLGKRKTIESLFATSVTSADDTGLNNSVTECEHFSVANSESNRAQGREFGKGAPLAPSNTKDIKRSGRRAADVPVRCRTDDHWAVENRDGTCCEVVMVTEEKALTCPVCGVFHGNQRSIDKHVDICLTKQSGILSKGIQRSPRQRPAAPKPTLDKFVVPERAQGRPSPR